MALGCGMRVRTVLWGSHRLHAAVTGIRGHMAAAACKRKAACACAADPGRPAPLCSIMKGHSLVGGAALALMACQDGAAKTLLVGARVCGWRMQAGGTHVVHTKHAWRCRACMPAVREPCK